MLFDEYKNEKKRRFFAQMEKHAMHFIKVVYMNIFMV